MEKKKKKTGGEKLFRQGRRGQKEKVFFNFDIWSRLVWEAVTL